MEGVRVEGRGSAGGTTPLLGGSRGGAVEGAGRWDHAPAGRVDGRGGARREGGRRWKGRGAGTTPPLT